MTRCDRLCRWLVAWLVVGLISFSSGGPAAARTYRDTDESTSVDDRPEIWYGWQTLVADGTSLAVFFGGVGADSGVIGGVGLAGLVLTAPIVHMFHKNPGRGIGDLALRVIVPIVAASVAHDRDVCDHDATHHDCNVGVVVGALGSLAIVSIIDAAAMSYEKVPYGTRLYGWSPTLTATPHGIVGGVGGTF